MFTAQITFNDINKNINLLLISQSIFTFSPGTFVIKQMGFHRDEYDYPSLDEHGI